MCTIGHATRIGDQMKARLRAGLSAALSKVLDAGSPEATQRYLDFVGRAPESFSSARRVRQVLLNLPSSGTFTVRVENDGDSFLYCTDPSDDFHLSCRMQFREYEPGTRAAFARLARISSAVVDVGAYAGLYSLIAATANPECSVVAFEPNPATFRLLERNVGVNELGSRVHALQLGLADSNGDVLLFGASDESASTTASLVQPLDETTSEAATRVRVTRLDEIPTVHPIDLIKIDVEGGEVSALRGAAHSLATFRPTLLTEALTEAELLEQRSFLTQFGYAQPLRARARHSSDDRNYFWIHPSRLAQSLEALGDAIQVT